MTGLFIDIEEYITSSEEEAVQIAIRYGTPIGRREEYTMIPSISNEVGWEKRLMPGSRGIGRHR